jgi:hypothetical protein
MAYRIVTNPTYWWPLEVSQPVDGGTVEAFGFEARYRALDDDEFQALMTEVAEKKLEDRVFVRRVVVELRGLVGETGQPLQHTAELFEHMLRQPGVAEALARRYFESRQEAALGNLRRPPASGQAAAPQPVTTH